MPAVNWNAEIVDEIQDWRRWLHRNPELGFDLPRVATFVAGRLREIGVAEVHEGIAGSGIVALVRGWEAGACVGLRAGRDALLIREETGAAHVSENVGRMHACGRDGHTSMLLGAVNYLAETRFSHAT